MKEMEITSDWIDRYTDGDLNCEERRYFEQQMALNPVLRAEVRLDKKINQMLAEGDILDLMNKIRAVTGKPEKGRGRIGFLLAAATVLCLVGVTLIMYLGRREEATVPSLSQKRAPAPVESPAGKHTADARAVTPTAKESGKGVKEKVISQDLLAANFTPMEELEQLVGSVTRSGPIRVTAPLPKLEINAGNPVKFEWTGQDSRHALMLVVMNNRGKTMIEMPCREGNLVLQTIGLSPGLYYWKIQENDELTMLGRITIKDPSQPR